MENAQRVLTRQDFRLGVGERSVPLALVHPEDEQVKVVVTRRRKPLRELGQFAMISQRKLLDTLADPDFPPGAAPLAVLLAVVANVDFRNQWIATSDDIADRARCSERSVRCALNALRARGLLAKLDAPSPSGAAVHMLNPYLAARGTSSHVRELQHAWDCDVRAGRRMA